MRLHRIAGIGLIALDIPCNPRFTGKDDIIADRNVTGAAYLAGKDDVISCLGTSGNANLGNEEAIFTNFDVMAQMDEVIDFRTSADECTAEGTVIDTRAGTDFYVIFEFDVANLGDTRMLAFIGSKAKAFAANDCMGTNDQAVAKLTIFVDDSARINDGIIADDHIIANEHIGINGAILAYFDMFANDCIGHHRGIFAKTSTGIDNGCRMNTLGYRLPRVKED